MKQAIRGLAVSLMSFAVAIAAQAQQTLTVDDLINKLQNRAPSEPGGATRGLTIEDLEKSQRNRVHVEPKLGGGRDLTIEDRREVADTVRRQALPTADLEVYFEYNSAAIMPAATSTLMTLGQALSDGRLKGGTFIVAGHTDAKGGADYNQALSQRRAHAVRDFLVSNFAIDPGKLIAIGYGKEQLKRPDEPFAGVNRRVQVINWTGVAAR